ncbi:MULTISPECIES: hypothetical protein [Bradyrhizobium]|uniref:hypothetical protein n=1 Tax=Bradyrhizobium TaxID=374 RepID=UPI00352C2218
MRRRPSRLIVRQVVKPSSCVPAALNGRVIERDHYLELGVLNADNLSPQKARILLALALTRTNKPHEIKRIFSEY